jgi:DNA polymerase-3 subunit alpha
MWGLPVRLAVQRVVVAESSAVNEKAASRETDMQGLCAGAIAELHLGENARFYPSDAALADWRAQANGGKAVIAYD